MRSYLETPGLNLRLVTCLATARTSTGMRRVWGWARQEATGNQCLGTKALVLKRVNQFRSGLASRNGEVKWRCRTVLQSGAEALLRDPQPDSGHTPNAHPTLALV